MDDLGGKIHYFRKHPILCLRFVFLLGGGNYFITKPTVFIVCRWIFLIFNVWKVDDLCYYVCIVCFFLMLIFFFATKVRFVELPFVS